MSVLFKGLPSEKVSMLRHCGAVRSLAAGEILFKEGDPAYGLYYVIAGGVEILRKTPAGEVLLATLQPEEVFGEMGLLTTAGTRTAWARGASPQGAVVFEVSVNPVALLERIGDVEGATVVLQNLVGVLARTLARKDEPGAPHVRATGREHSGSGESPREALAAIEASLPGGIWARLFHRRTLKPGQVLCRAGEEPDGFYFIHGGLLHVHKGDATAGDPAIAEVYAPAIAGEVGFFAGTARSATLVAAIETDVTHFTAREFRRLRRDRPQDALHVLLSAAQLAVCLIAQREER